MRTIGCARWIVRLRLAAVVTPLATALALGGCAGSGLPAGGAGPTTPSPVPVPFRGVPGFDTRVYPGDAAMQRWRDESPYRWVGYYLPAPCHTDTSWVGRRAALESMGWGMAVIFTGEQDWAAAAPVTGPSGGAATPAPRCTRANLTPAKGAADALLADSLMASEGFANGSSIFLDVERVEAVSPELSAYVVAWTGALLQRGRYVPALYAHARNAAELLAAVRAEMAQRGATPSARLWMAGGAGSFDVHAAPVESGVDGASVWQGAANSRESHGGVTLAIDVNVADRPSPSAPDGGGGASR